MNKTKICSRCGEEKPLTDFQKWNKSKDGRSNVCKACAKIGFPETMKELFRKTGQPDLIYMLDTFGDTPMNDIVIELRRRGYRGSVLHMAAQMYIHDKGIKRCSKCGEYKPIEEFSKSRKIHNGFTYCKVCEKAAKAEYSRKARMKKDGIPSPKMAEIKALADKCRQLRIRKILNGC